MPVAGRDHRDYRVNLPGLVGSGRDGPKIQLPVPERHCGVYETSLPWNAFCRKGLEREVGRWRIRLSDDAGGRMSTKHARKASDPMKSGDSRKGSGALAPVPLRRQALSALAALGASAALWPSTVFAQNRPFITRPIPSTGESLPVIGLGSWITFNVGNDRVARDSCTEVMRNFFDAGGRMIDSSPMYGSSQDVIGYGLQKLGKPQRAFSADKVWISSGSAGRSQIEKSRQRWGVSRFDLVAVHNLLSWQEHLPTLLAMKAAGDIRYVGVTTSEGRRHQEIEEIMRRQPLDFVQVSYSAVERDVEARILPLARDRGIAVVVNRPFREGTLIRAVKRQPLPDWAREADCANWAEFLLKFIVSHPAVVCAIPATTSVEHVRENMGACLGRLPDEPMRRRMAAHVEQF